MDAEAWQISKRGFVYTTNGPSLPYRIVAGRENAQKGRAVAVPQT